MSELMRLAQWKVAENEIDHLGHMNIHFYGRRAGDGCAAVLASLGLAGAELADAGLMSAIVDQHTMYRREQLVHAPLSIAGAVTAAQADAICVYMEMSNDITGDLAATFLFGVQLKDRATRAAAQFPDVIVQAASARLAKAPARSQPRSVPLDRMGANLAIDDFARLGIASHSRREVEAADCDEDGFQSLSRPARMSPQRGGQGVMDQVWGSIAGFAWPALETRTLTMQAARIGDRLDTYTALLLVSHKIIQAGSWTFEARSGRLMSVSQQVNIFFDLKARRAHDIPADARVRLSKLAHPELLGKVRAGEARL